MDIHVQGSGTIIGKAAPRSVRADTVGFNTSLFGEFIENFGVETGQNLRNCL